jgi:microcystin degradation protein MlrC
MRRSLVMSADITADRLRFPHPNDFTRVFFHYFSMLRSMLRSKLRNSLKLADNISIELLQAGESLSPQEPWSSMPNEGSW